jgi:hypothetical protein
MYGKNEPEEKDGLEELEETRAEIRMKGRPRQKDINR